MAMAESKLRDIYFSRDTFEKRYDRKELDGGQEQYINKIKMVFLRASELAM